MPATMRRRVVVAFLPVVALLGSVSVLPGPGGWAATAAEAAMAPAGVTVAVAAGGRDMPAYRIEVRNETNAGVDTTVRQEMPRGTTVQSVSEGGQAAVDGTGTEVAWHLHLPARSTATLRTTLAPVPADAPLAAPACAFVGEGAMAYDCATAVWGLHPGDRGPAWWQRSLAIVGLVVGLLALVAFGWRWRVVRRRRARRPPTRSGPGRAAPPQPAPRTPPPVKPMASGPATPPASRRAPPTWRVVSFAALLLFATIALIMWIGGTRVAALEPNAESTTGAWVGAATAGEVGMAMRDSAFEFTVYRLSCSPGGPPDQQTCVTTVGLRNVSDASQPWYGGMQRAYLPSGTWVTTDEAATRAANGGHDIFAHPIPAGGVLLAPLVFTVPGAAAPTKFELRSAVFSAGVTVVP